MTGGSPSGRSMTAPVSSITASSALIALSSGWLSGISVRTSWPRPTRENVSRSLISTCSRLAPSTAKSMYCRPRSSSWSPYRFSSSWQNEATLRSGSWRSCEAT